MTVLQLIRGGKQGLEPLPNPDQLRPAQMVREGKDTFLAGSDDLIWIAFDLSLSSFRVVEFHFVDRYFLPIDDGEGEWLSNELVRVIDDRKSSAITHFIDAYLDGRFVEQVRLHNEITRNDMTVVQEGIIYAQDEDFPSLSAALKRVNPYR